MCDPYIFSILAVNIWNLLLKPLTTKHIGDKYDGKC